MSLLFAYSKQKTSQANGQILLGWYAWKCTCKSASAMYKCALNDEASILRALRQSRTAMWASFFHFLCDQYIILIIPDNFLLKIQKKSSMLRPWETVLLEYTNTHALEHRWYKNPFHQVLHCMLQCRIINPNPPPKSLLQFGPISCTSQTTIKHKIRHNIQQQLQIVGLDNKFYSTSSFPTLYDLHLPGGIFTEDAVDNWEWISGSWGKGAKYNCLEISSAVYLKLLWSSEYQERVQIHRWILERGQKNVQQAKNISSRCTNFIIEMTKLKQA